MNADLSRPSRGHLSYSSHLLALYARSIERVPSLFIGVARICEARMMYTIGIIATLLINEGEFRTCSNFVGMSMFGKKESRVAKNFFV